MQELVAALGSVNDGDELTLTITGKLFDGLGLEGDDCVIIKAKGGKLKKSVADLIANIPDDYALLQNYPNPFNPTTEIRFDLPESSQVRLEIYNLLGQKMRILFDGTQAAGSHSIQWDAKDDFGLAVPGGVYLYRMQAGAFNEIRKMILMK